jgi:hypothetical protein
MQKLPIGIQDFRELREGNYVYVDKTKYIFRLVDQGKYYFLSRPRRFGKSLLVSTLKELFTGRRELFAGLWIAQKWDWAVSPVLHFDFSNANFKEIGLRAALRERLQELAAEHQIELAKQDLVGQFQELLQKLAVLKGKVVVLIDEYDRPITEYLTDLPQAQQNREIIKDFFSIMKPNDAHLRLLFMTGVSKFSKVSMFSGFNNLSDITYHPAYNSLLGYTQAELESYFAPHLDELVQPSDGGRPQLLASLREWYNGYNWDGPDTVYNPFSILNFLDSHGKFGNYWFASGTPGFLTKLVSSKFAYEFEGLQVSDPNLFDNFELENISPPALLLQTGYLTVKEARPNRYTLGYPNREVRESFLQYLLASYAQQQSPEVRPLVWQLAQAFASDDLAQVVATLNGIFAHIPHQIFDQGAERYYHAVIYLTFLLLGYDVQAEVSTALGRIDAVVKTNSAVYVLEFKVNDTADAALAQVRERRYHEKYLLQGLPVYLVGLACAQKRIASWQVELAAQA